MYVLCICIYSVMKYLYYTKKYLQFYFYWKKSESTFFEILQIAKRNCSGSQNYVVFKAKLL